MKLLNYVVVIAISVCLGIFHGYAQPWFKRYDSVEVYINNLKLRNPWAGGLNNPQFSQIDLNGDGIKDLFVFDRSFIPQYDKIYTFINGGTKDKVDYQYAPEYAKKFPSLHNWALLVDYDCDGKEDIFTNYPGGIAVYRNTTVAAGEISFKQLTWPGRFAPLLLHSKYFSGTIPLYVSASDIPSISDIDNDGDVDILTFYFGGTTIELHRNFSKELYGICDSLLFREVTECWGGVSESGGDCKAKLDVSCKGGGKPDTLFDVKHQGGATLLALDLDCDTIKELLLGDQYCSNTVMLSNNGTLNAAHIFKQDTLFPSYSTPVNMHSFVANFFLDVDNDSLRDLISAPNAVQVSENVQSAHWYKNTGTDCGPVFSYRQKDFLQDEMIEMGEGVYPAFFDYDGDGLLDIVIGNHGYFVPPADAASLPQYHSSLALFKNTGTVTQPRYSLITRDMDSLSKIKDSETNYPIYDWAPAFGDMDNDGDKDMIAGTANGNLYYFENKGSAGNPARFVLLQTNLKDANGTVIKIDYYVIPQLVDVNRDGKLDILAGSSNGKVSWYENTGTIASPQFTLRSNFLGKINVVKKNSYTGYTSPFLLESGGKYKLLTGSESGYLYLYDNIDNNLNGTFNLVDSMYMNVTEGIRSVISGADVNNDGWMDIIAGNYAGGLTFYKGLSYNPVSSDDVSVDIPEEKVAIYPNPSAGVLTVTIGEKHLLAQLIIMDILGHVIEYRTMTSGSITINLSEYPPGIYFCKVNLGGATMTKKIILTSRP